MNIDRVIFGVVVGLILLFAAQAALSWRKQSQLEQHCDSLAVRVTAIDKVVDRILYKNISWLEETAYMLSARLNQRSGERKKENELTKQMLEELTERVEVLEAKK